MRELGCRTKIFDSFDRMKVGITRRVVVSVEAKFFSYSEEVKQCHTGTYVAYRTVLSKRSIIAQTCYLEDYGYISCARSGSGLI